MSFDRVDHLKIVTLNLNMGNATSSCFTDPLPQGKRFCRYNGMFLDETTIKVHHSAKVVPKDVTKRRRAIHVNNTVKV